MNLLPGVILDDPHDEQLVQNVRPPDWKNPDPAPRYNLVVIGAGSAGLITSALAAGLGARVALVERHLLGGDCLNVGCVPSKGIIREAHRVAEARAAAQVGLPLAPDAQVDFGAAMARMRSSRARISFEDAASRYRNELGVDVFFGDARFSGPDTVEVGGKALRFTNAVIATGARAADVSIPGLAEAGYLTNESVFTLTQRPPRLGVIGSGPIGCEMAQAFQRLGTQVTLLEAQPQILTREDPDAAQIVQNVFAREGIDLALGSRIRSVRVVNGEKRIELTCVDGGEREVAVDEILVAAGRQPNLEGLDLETVGVAYDERRGLEVDDRLRTTNRRIYAAGDICMNWKFTHAADAAAKIVVQNALFFGRKKLSDLIMPWCTYTAPEVAHVGLYERDARGAGIEIEIFKVPLERVNRAVLDGEEEGFVKVHVKKGTDKIVGATIVAAHAGEMISELTLAMVGGLGLGTILNVIHPYPTQAEGIKRVAGEHARRRLTPLAKRVLERWMAWRR